MLNIGINGFGRIGKSILTQALSHKDVRVAAINYPGFNIESICSYLRHDSAHHTKHMIDVKVVNGTTININNQDIHILNNRIPKPGMWNDYGAGYVFDTTGNFLSDKLARLHNSDYFIMCAPPKDQTPQYLYNGNHNKYGGERVVSNSSCTTNCVVPLINLLNQHYGIDHVNFITIHAATASQNVLDGVHLRDRSHRSIFNNIIPHTTGASRSIIKIIPELDGKVFGTSVRIPTSNVSMVDINVTLRLDVSLDDILNGFRESGVVEVSDDPHLVSSDFMTTTSPTIIDSVASMEMGNKQYKFTVWYDNEWSYSAQALRMAKHMYGVNGV